MLPQLSDARRGRESLRSRASATFATLRFHNYRLYLVAQVVSQNGTWMQRVAQYWLVLHLTGSGTALGLTGAFESLPILFFGSWGGLAADRVDKRRLVMMTQAAAGLQGVVLAGLTLTGRIELWMIYVLALCLGFVKMFDNPARQSFIMEMVGREHITNAVGLNSAVMTSSRMVGPAIGGVLIATAGAGICFLVNGVSYFALVLVLLRMRTTELEPAAPAVRRRGQIREGLRYVWGHPELRPTLILLTTVGTFAFNWNVVFPLLAQRTFHGDAGTYGAMLAMLGAGSLLGALVAAQRTVPTIRLLVYSTVLLGALMLLAAFVPSLPLEMLVLVPVGAALVTSQATGSALLQLRSRPEFRGRVMALYVTAFLGTTPIGGPIVGWVSEEFGGRAGLALGGLASLAAAAVVVVLVRGHHRGHEEDRAPAAEPADAALNERDVGSVV